MMYASKFSVNCRRFFTASTLQLNSKSVAPVTDEDCLKRGQKGFTKDGGHIYHGFTYHPRYYTHCSSNISYNIVWFVNELFFGTRQVPRSPGSSLRAFEGAHGPEDTLPEKETILG